MKHYIFYSVEEFVQDSRFRAWVRNPSPHEDSVWQEWIRVNTHKQQVIEEARAIVLAIHPINTENISDAEIDHEIQSILQGLDDESTVENGSAKKRSVSLWWKVAASVVVIALAGWYALNYFRPAENNSPESVASLNNYLIEYVNKSKQPLLVNLPDNSSVLLSQNSLIRYPKEFSGSKRNVFLEGNAFFEVTKDPDKPFYVEAGQIVAKVLGTSFEIRNDPADKEIRLIVKSGKVSVYAHADPGKDFDDQPNVVLTKDDQLIYKSDVSKLQHTRLDSVSMVTLKVPDTQMQFRNIPVSKVFSDLSKAYGVKINYEQAEISGCTVTASFTDEPFTMKLDLICRSIGVEYEVANNWVTVKGTGCNK